MIAVLLTGAFWLGLFFGGYADLVYAPAFFCVLAAVSFAAGWRGGMRMPTGAPVLFLFMFWMLAALSLSWSAAPFSTLLTLIVLSCLPVAFFAATMREDSETLAVTGIMASLAVLAGWALVQYVFLRHSHGVRASGPLPDANNLAALLNLGLFPALAAILATPRNRWLWALAALLFAGLLATQSRGGLLCLLAVFPVLAAAMRGGWKRPLAITGAGAGIFALMQIMPSARLAGRMALLTQPMDDPNVVSRIELWKSTLAMIRDHPWTGTGLGTFHLFYPRHRVPGADNSTGYWAHMDPLQFAAEMGIAAPLLFYALAFAVVVMVVRGLRTGERARIAGFSCGLLAVFLYSHLTFHFYVMPILIVCGVWLAVLYRLCGDRFECAEGWQAMVMRGYVLGSAVLLGLLTASSAAGQFYLLRAVDNIGQGQIDAFLDDIERARRFGPNSFVDPDVQLAGFYADAISNGKALYTEEERQELFAAGIALLAVAGSKNPAWAEIDQKRGKLYAAYGEKDQAIESWMRALEKNPLHDRARLALADALVSQGRPAAAYDILERGTEWTHSRRVALEYEAAMTKIGEAARIQREMQEP